MSVISLGMSAKVLKQCGDHDHSVWEIVLNTQGKGYTIIGHNRYEFGPGSIICQPPNIPHAKYSQEGFIDIYYQSTSFPLAKPANESGPFIFQDDADKSFETLILMAHRAYHERKNNHMLFTNSLLDAMNQLLISWRNHPTEENDIANIKKILIKNYSDPEFTINQILNDSPYSNDHLRRRFKKATGQTPGEYLADLRIEYAKKLMAENRILRYNIAEIGVMSGYYDSHYFSRIFKKKVGITPIEFLRQINVADSKNLTK